MAIKFISIIYKKADPSTDFIKLIKKDKNSLFIFNDNEEHFPNSCQNGRGNAAIRSYRCTNPVQAVGIPTGTLNKGGYSYLTKHRKTIINKGFNILKNLLATGIYDKVYFNIDKNGEYGTGIFVVGESVKQYILDKILKISQKYTYTSLDQKSVTKVLYIHAGNLKANMAIVKQAVDQLKDCFPDSVSASQNIDYIHFTHFLINEVGRHMVILVKANTVIASALIEINVATKVAEIHNVCVLRKYRGKGLCHRLMTECQKDLRTNTDMKEVIVYCLKNNIAACKCYRATFDTQQEKEDRIVFHSMLR